MKKDEVSRACFYSHTVMMLTSIHHVYGAEIYHTPWRYHVLFASVPTIIFTEVLKRLIVRRDHNVRGTLLFLFWSLTFIVSVALIGFFEGFYNHVLKVVLYYSDSQEMFRRLFPPPKYVAPEDFVFELTGILQGLVTIPLLWWWLASIKKYAVQKKIQ